MANYNIVYEKVKEILNTIKGVNVGSASQFRQNINDNIGVIPQYFDDDGVPQKDSSKTEVAKGVVPAVYYMGSVVETGLSEVETAVAGAKEYGEKAKNITKAVITDYINENPDIFSSVIVSESSRNGLPIRDGVEVEQSNGGVWLKIIS